MARTIFSQTLSALNRSDAFLTAVERRMRANGEFALDPGEPVEDRYVYRDETTGELVKLWRTADDVRRQLKYKRYRKVMRLGTRHIMKEEMPELFLPDERHKREQQVRAYDMVKLISAALTSLTCGGGITAETGIEVIDNILEELDLEKSAMKWSFQASVFEFVGIKVQIDPFTQTVSLCRVWPDYLYFGRDSTNQDELEFIAQRTWMPLERVENWTPISVEVQSGTGLSQAAKASKTGRAGSGVDEIFEVAQDGFVLEERHFRGWIEYHFFAVAGDRILCEVPLAAYDRELARNPVYFTGMRDFAITIFPNVGMGDDDPVSDWDELLDPAIDFNVRATKNGRLVDRYSKPREVVPASHIQVDPITGKAVWGMGDDDIIVTRPSDHTEPSFLQPNANFDAPREDLSFALSMLGVLSATRYAIDPEVIDQVDSGVALKLKMAPALAKIEPRRGAQVEALRCIVYNILSGVEFVASKPADEFQQAREKAMLGVLHWRGPIAVAVENIADEMRENGKLMRDVHMGGSRQISVKRLAPLFAHLDTTSADEIAERTVRAARARFLLDADKQGEAAAAKEAGAFDADPAEVRGAREAFMQRAIDGDGEEEESEFGEETAEAEEFEGGEEESGENEERPERPENTTVALAPFDPDKAFAGDDGEAMMPGQQIGRNIVNATEAPDMIPIETLQRQVDALYVAENAITKAGLKIRMAPGLPQDHAEATSRVSDGTMSLFRLLTEFDGMTEEEAQEEQARITDEQSNAMTGDSFGIEEPAMPGVAPETQHAREFMMNLQTNTQTPEEALLAVDQMDQNLRRPNPEGAHDQNDNVGETLQARGGEA